jgi:hypothetical protein
MGLTTSSILAYSGTITHVGIQKTTILPLATATVLSSPAAGFFRVCGELEGVGVGLTFVAEPSDFASVSYYAKLVGAFGNVSITFDPNPNFTAGYNGSNLYPGATLFSGESITIENLDPTHTIYVRASYLDASAVGVTSYRVLTNGTLPVVLIPSPAPGKVHMGVVPSIHGLEAEPRVVYKNRDDVAHGYTVEVGGANVAVRPPGYTSPGYSETDEQTFVTESETMTFALAEATNSVQGIVYGMYKTVDRDP